jgi:hypothetical protein
MARVSRMALRYWGKPCKHGHGCWRYKARRTCVECCRLAGVAVTVARQEGYIRDALVRLRSKHGEEFLK